MTKSESEQYNLLDQLAEEFAERFRRGELPAIEEYTDRYPDLADEIRELFPAMVMVEQVEGSRQVEQVVAGESRVANPPPRLVGDYRILREIGRGGMGVVYEAEQVSLGRRVALKVLPGRVSGDRMILERFRREARAAAGLHHTNIVPVYEVGRDRDVRFYAMQLIQGLGLDAVILELRRHRNRSRSESGISPAIEGQSPHPSPEHSRRGTEGPTLGEGVEFSAVLQSILTGRYDPGGGGPESLRASPSLRARTPTRGLAKPAKAGTDRWATASDPALSGTEAASATAGDAAGPDRMDPPAPDRSASAPSSSSSAILPGGTQLSVGESGRRPLYRSLAQIGRQVAGGLSHAHARGIIHRDIKPSNLLLDTEGVVWITDFGLAKGDDEGLTHTGDILGTIRYMAPERFRGEGDARADIYALGMTLYELLTLRSGFGASDRLELIEQIKSAEPRRPRALDDHIPRDLETIVLKAIEKDPSARYQSAEAMGEDLRRFLADEPIVARPVLFWERGVKWARRRPGLAALFALVQLLLAGLLGLGVWSYLQIGHALETAQEERAKADVERMAAVAAARNETAAHNNTARANERLRRTQEELRQTLYATRSNLALAAWEGNDIGRIRFLLDSMQPGQGEPDLRGWEWNYLHRLAHEERLTFGDHDREVSQVAFSPDGRTVASVQWGGRIQLWDPADGNVRLTLQTRQPAADNPMQSGVSGLAFSPDGERLAGPGPDATLGIWNTRTGALLLHFKVVSGGTLGVAFSPDGGQIATASMGRKVRLWDAADGRLRHVFENADGRAVQRIVFSPDGRTVASAGQGTINLWDVEAGRRRVALPSPDDYVFALAFSPDGRTLVSGGSGQVLRTWDAGTGREIGQLRGHRATVTALAFHPDGRRLASAGSDAVVRLWDIDTGRPVRTFKGHTDRVCWVAFSPDGNTLASCSFDRTVKLWDAGSPSRPLVLRCKSLKSFDQAPHCVAFSPDGRQIVSGHSDHAVRVWEAASGRLRLTLTGPDNDVTSVAFSPSGQTIASTSQDDAVWLWDAATGQLRSRLAQETGKVFCARFSPDGRRLVSTTRGGGLKVWDLETGRSVLSISGQAESPYSAEYSPDGRTLATIVGEGRVRLRDAETGRQVSTIGDHRMPARDFTFSPDGRSIAVCYKDKQVMTWATATGRLQLALKGHTDMVDSAAFSPDGRRLVSSGHDQTIRIWDLASGQALLTLKGHTGWVRALAFSRDGRRIASAGDDGNIIVWDASPRAPPPDEPPGPAAP